MEELSASSKTLIGEIRANVEKQQVEQKKVLLEERKVKREETHKRFQEIKEIINENLSVIGIIKDICSKLKFNGNYNTKKNYIYYIFSLCIISIAFFCIWNYNKVNTGVKFFYVYLIASFVLINFIVFYIINRSIQKRIYVQYINKCKDNNINNEDVLKLVNVVIDNNLKIVGMLPNNFFKYFAARYAKRDTDIYIRFLCKNNKILSKKCKNKNLGIYKKIYSRNMEMLLDIEDMENNYFMSKLDNSEVDTIEECVKKFLHNI